ncbi:glutaminyl-peptide cyclotransferase-like [Mya arenaria]|uniref:glutaminyl-peptide cyclotransferase-like n=1 Tax=Mya arenaria TaxID=6604 RepID=UPI0022E09314|nr:glutaminyl-peptide cyclotransferase-like [Mya arenaria]
MWKQISFFYSFLFFGVCCSVIPLGNSALNQRMKVSSSKEMRIFAQDISSNEDFKNTVFRNLVRPLLIPRMPDTENSTIVQNYIKSHFSNLNWEVEEDRFSDSTPYGVKEFNNIIVTYQPEVKNKLVLSCHYDSKNISSRGNYFIAATDSAVPCAILMDIATKLNCALLRKQQTRKKSLAEDVTIQMMFFDGEEAYEEWTATDSLYGSRHLAKKLAETYDTHYPDTTRMDTISLFVLLDLIGSSDVEFRNFYIKTDAHFQMLQKIEKSLKKADLLNPNGRFQNGREKTIFTNARPYGGIEDDHRPFLLHSPDLPVLHLISVPFPSVWHKMSDNENAIDYHVTDNFNRVFRIFVANYLHLSTEACKKK